MSSIEAVEHLRIPLQELSDASNGFSDENIIAKGGFGNVYKGESVKHGKIAIKMLDPGQGQGDHEFRTEISLLSLYKHENIVSLIGFCDEDGLKILVYKYEDNGSLEKHLSNTDLTWIRRLQICLDAARGLQYLHDDVGADHRILHRDVKSSNILLDENWKAKISDFGLCRVGPANKQTTFLISNACGTFGYIDPDYLNTGYLTQRSDVYSFGVVLFEVLCGRPTIVSKHKDNRVYLTNLIKTHWRKKTFDDIIYSDLQKQINTSSLLTFTTIAYQCLKSGNERPTMKKVVEQLQKALYNQLNTQKDSSEEEGAVGYIHAERVGREKINERMKLLQDIVPGCDKVTRKALILDEIINYVRSLQNQVEFLSMKLASVNPMLYDFGLDLDAFMLKPDEIMSSLALPIMPIAQQCSLDGGSATFAPSNDNYNYQLLPQLIDGSAATNSLLFQQAHVPNILLQTSSVSDDSGFATHLQGQSGLSASSPQSTHVSSSQSWEYDVFVSFRGEDTRKTFTDYLYSALVYRQINTYRDDKTLPRGESMIPSLFKSIQNSRIAIIIFSKNYAASSWWLDELAFIMKNRDERGQIVIPIFYDVEPSEVREQTGHYREALRNHELLYDDNKVQSWREALTWAGGLSGWECSNRLEVDLIRQICDDISYKLGYNLPSFEASGETSANTYLVGMETRMQELKSLLEARPGGVSMVGICGMWGSGKSTLASFVYDEISREFEGSCFVINVKARSRMLGFKTLQEEILSNVLKLEVTFTNLEQGRYMMETRLRQKSVLIVLDDVPHPNHLKMLAGSPNWFGKGSRVIFTTRNQNLLNDYNVRTHNVRMLDDTEAIEVFSWHAFGKREPVQGFEKESLSMVSRCGGHPSVLKNLGSFLQGRRRSEWLRILVRLEGIPVDEILKNFKIRDDGVGENIFDQLLD